MKLKNKKIMMDDLWNNYSFMLRKDGDDSNKFITVKVKDFFDSVDFTEDEE